MRRLAGLVLILTSLAWAAQAAAAEQADVTRGVIRAVGSTLKVVSSDTGQVLDLELPADCLLLGAAPIPISSLQSDSPVQIHLDESGAARMVFALFPGREGPGEVGPRTVVGHWKGESPDGLTVTLEGGSSKTLARSPYCLSFQESEIERQSLRPGLRVTVVHTAAQKGRGKARVVRILVDASAGRKTP